MDNLSVFGDIGNVLGYPAMLLIFWLYTKVKDMQKRLEEGDRIIKELRDTLGELNSNVAFIRGLIEGKNTKKQ